MGMSSTDTIIAIDQGTTSTRAILFDSERMPLASAQRELTQHYPHPGWVEQNPDNEMGRRRLLNMQTEM